jgi:hypothetical protein
VSKAACKEKKLDALKTLDLLDMGGASATTSLMLYFVLFCVL